MPLLRSRRICPELLDNAAPCDAERNLADLRRLNSSFGGHQVLRAVFRQVLPAEGTATLLDIGAASGDTAELIQRLCPNVRVTSLDYRWFHLLQAPAPKLVADAFELPFAPASFDYVFCSLFLHHFPDADVVRLLRSFYRLCRHTLVVSDLERNVVAQAFVPLTSRIFGWSRLTRHDAPVSVRAAFTAQELKELAQSAGLHHATVRKHRPAFRLSLLAPKEG